MKEVHSHPIRSMPTFILHEGADGDLIIETPGGRGYMGAQDSSSLFAVDAWRLSEGAPTELGKGHRDWRGLEPDAWTVAEWNQRTGFQAVDDPPLPGGTLARYLGMDYAPMTWGRLDADEWRVALLAAASGSEGWECAVEALGAATGSQLEALTKDDYQTLLSHPWGALRLAAIQRAAQIVRAAAPTSVPRGIAR